MNWKDTWQGIREGWNAEGKCSREACKAPLGRAHYRYPSNGLLYCKSCGWLLERNQPGLTMELIELIEIEKVME